MLLPSSLHIREQPFEIGVYNSIYIPEMEYLSRLMGNPTICICENKDADQRLCFRNSDTTTPPLLNSIISSF